MLTTRDRFPDPLTKAQRRRYEKARKALRRKLQPHIDEIRRSRILTAADYAITINAR